MKTLNQFHDGSLDGLLIEGSAVHLFLTTEDRQTFVLELGGLLSLKADGIREGNIVFDVLLRQGSELTSDDVSDLFGFKDQSRAAMKLKELQEENASIVEVNPSYGGSCLILATSVEVIDKREWLLRCAQIAERLETEALRAVRDGARECHRNMICVAANSLAY